MKNINNLPSSDQEKLLSYLYNNALHSEKHKLLYVATPKVACTTLKWWFAEIEGYTKKLRHYVDSAETDPDLKIHDTFYKVAPEIAGLHFNTLSAALSSAEYFRFALVRNPFERIFSAWQSKLLLREPLQIAPYKNYPFYNQEITTPSDIAIAFEGFLEHLVANEYQQFIDIHWTPQFDLLRPDIIEYSIISKIENAEQLTSALINHIKTKFSEPFSNKTLNKSLIPYSSEFLTSKSEHIIRFLYAKDFESFGYSEDLPVIPMSLSDEHFNTITKAINFIRARHERLEEIRGQNNLLVNKSEKLEHALNQRTAEINCLERTLNQRTAEINNLNIEIEFQNLKIKSILLSNSWLLTKPLRFARKVLIILIQKFICLFGKASKNLIFKQINCSKLRFKIDHEIQEIAKSGLFDKAYYLKKYPDIAPDLENPIKHYCEYGWREGRNPSDDFDTVGYLKVYSDIKNADINPFWHYITAGIHEGRQPTHESNDTTGIKLFFDRILFIRIITFYKLCLVLISAVPKAISFYRGSFWLTLIRAIRIASREGFEGVFRRVEFLTGTVINKKLSKSKFLYEVPKVRPSEFSPKVSVIVPNFNHAKYLRRRLDSIYSQTYQNFEVILLDDCSTDESLKILHEYSDLHSDNTITCFNDVNSGGVFHQWKKGLALCKGELIWIAESDDDCQENFLEELVKFFSNHGVMLAFARTEFVRSSKEDIVFTQEQYLTDLFHDIWLSPFVKSANELVRIGWVAKNLIPNVSAALFRKPSELKLLDDEYWLNLNLCGDWAFYLNIIRGGLVGYSPATTNFYRQHIQSTSLKTQKEDKYYIEHEYIGKQLMHLYSVGSEDLLFQQRILFKHWIDNHVDLDKKDFLKLYSIDRIQASSIISNRKPNIAIAIYALSTGGGEIFPIKLANELWLRGYPVTIINFQGSPDELEIGMMINPSIPVINLSRIELIGSILSDLGVEIVNSHHASVDNNIAIFTPDSLGIKHVVTMHGMYEMISSEHLEGIKPILASKVDCFIYTAEKNLLPFSPVFCKENNFIKINNALPLGTINPILRANLNLDADDFVLCMAARAIPDKAWEDAISAVSWAAERSDRRIHLLLIGEGPEFERLSSIGDYKNVSFLGFRSNIRDYFAMSDIGFLPSRFRGESAPLVLIDCLFSGRPFLASNIGEIKSMLSSESGMAGEVFDLCDWKVPVELVGQIILDLASDKTAYKNLIDRVPLAAKKFDMVTMVDRYESVYRSVASS